VQTKTTTIMSVTDSYTKTLRLALTIADSLAKSAGIGVYKGQEEDSLVVLVNNETDIQTVKDFAFKSFNQESVLYQDANQEAYLIVPRMVEPSKAGAIRTSQS
jgi:hypothetical protein